ncbi:MAG TPA: DUF2550 family protein [Actinotalea sp.]|nr:DUF2550 family protein [Actinotalea sp.]
MELVTALMGVGAVLLVVIVAAGLYVSRVRSLSQRVGSFTCHLRSAPAGLGAPGVAHYGPARLAWWRTVSLAPRPARTWQRDRLDLVELITLDQVDEEGRPMVRVLCRHDDAQFELTMSAAAHSGLVSWVEAGPRTVGRAV